MAKKGWKGEPARHALAARGIKTKLKKYEKQVRTIHSQAININQFERAIDNIEALGIHVPDEVTDGEWLQDWEIDAGNVYHKLKKLEASTTDKRILGKIKSLKKSMKQSISDIEEVGYIDDDEEVD